MSWGYFLDLHLSLPDDAWARLADARVGDFPIPLGWWGFLDRELERRFVEIADGGGSFDPKRSRPASESSISIVTPSGESTRRACSTCSGGRSVPSLEELDVRARRVVRGILPP